MCRNSLYKISAATTVYIFISEYKQLKAPTGQFLAVKFLAKEVKSTSVDACKAVSLVSILSSTLKNTPCITTTSIFFSLLHNINAGMCIFHCFMSHIVDEINMEKHITLLCIIS